MIDKKIGNSSYYNSNDNLFMAEFSSLMHNSHMRAITEFDYVGTYPQDDDPADYYRPIKGVRIA